MNNPSTPPPCPTCPLTTWASFRDPNTTEGERRIRRDERAALGRMVRRTLRPDELEALSFSDQRLVVHFAQVLMDAIAQRENEAA